MASQATALPEVWQAFIKQCQDCRACQLGSSRQQAVVWRGGLQAPLMLIGEGPGAEEDRQGKPFVGASGQLLQLLLTAWEIPEEQVHICNIVKCRPPGNRTPQPEEVAACRPFLARQIKLVRPKVIVLMGSPAYRYFTGRSDGITKVRGIWLENQGYQILPTFHPAYVLRDNRRRVDLWQDLGSVRQRLSDLGLMAALSEPADMPTSRK